MKKIFSIIPRLLLAGLVVSCSKQIPEEPVSYACAHTSDTKATLASDKSVYWSEGDKIAICKSEHSYEYTLDSGAGSSSGVFKHTGAVESGAGYTAYYPSTYDGAAWPVTQKYVPAGASARENMISYAPMIAENISIDSEGRVSDISFRNAGGIMQIRVKGSDRISFVTVEAEGLPRITLECLEAGVAMSQSEFTTFNVAIPAGNYTGGLINLISDKSAAVTLKAASFKVERNKVYSYEFAEAFDFPPYVDLGLSVYWAICNLGASSAEEYGNYYMWGSVEDNTSGTCSADGDYPFKGLTRQQIVDSGALDTNWNLTASYDPASKASTGRMPTYNEFKEELMDGTKCSWTVCAVNSVYGYKVTSRMPGYEGRFIFLPFAGQRVDNKFEDKGEWGYYWSSSHSYITGYDDTSAYNMMCYDVNHPVQKNARQRDMSRSEFYYGMPVRPVYPKN